MTKTGPTMRTRLALACTLVFVAVALPACKMRTSPDVTGAITPTDVRERHPIVLSEAPHSLELYPGPGGRLSARQQEDLAAFAALYRQEGRSIIVAEAPSNGHHAAAGVRAALARSGLAGGQIQYRTYPAPDYTVAAPIRLSFARLKARVPHECGQWPEDFGVSNPGFSAQNRPYWNLGCATQANLAAQVADPLDLARSRQEGRVDTIRRTAGIEKLRKGEDPSTQYRTEASGINKTLGN